MSQQNTTKDASNKFKRSLFVDTGFGYQEVANSKGYTGNSVDKINAPSGTEIGRIVEEYKSPSPTYQTAEIKPVSAPSIIHAGGKTNYKAQLRIIFKSKLQYDDFLFYSGNGIKYYDENGAIYKGAINEPPDVTMVNAGTWYDVKLSLILTIKENYDRYTTCEFTDIKGHWAEDVIKEMAAAGLITQMDRKGNYVYTFRPNSYTTRAEATSFLNRLCKYVERIVRG